MASPEAAVPFPSASFTGASPARVEEIPSGRRRFSAFSVVLVAVISAVLSTVATVTLMQRLQPVAVPVPAAPAVTATGSSTVPREYAEAVERRMKQLATINANTLVRLEQAEAEIVRLQTAQRASFKARQDLALRVETLSGDFKRVPNTPFSEPGFRP